MVRLPKYLVNLAGEYRVCSELNRRGVFTTVTYGLRKGVDVYAIHDRISRALRIEVKTSQKKDRFVTGLSPEKRANQGCVNPDFWVLFQFRSRSQGTFSDRFFILSHKEICHAQELRDAAYNKKYLASHGHEFNFSNNPFYGLRLADVELYEGQWNKIVTAIGGPDAIE